MIPLKGGHAFAGDLDALARAAVAHCARCGAVVRDRRGSVTSLPCPLASAAPTPVAATVQDELRALVDQAREQGRADERARVIRIRNAAFTGVAVDSAARTALTRFDGMLVRGEDVTS